MKKLTLDDFKGNASRYNFYLEAHNILSEMEKQRVGMMAEEQIEENTSVNMSPYKDSIKNAESPKSKRAKNKINDLFRK